MIKRARKGANGASCSITLIGFGMIFGVLHGVVKQDLKQRLRLHFKVKSHYNDICIEAIKEEMEIIENIPN